MVMVMVMVMMILRLAPWLDLLLCSTPATEISSGIISQPLGFIHNTNISYISISYNTHTFHVNETHSTATNGRECIVFFGCSDNGGIIWGIILERTKIDCGGWIDKKGLWCWESGWWIFLLGKENVKINVASLSELDWVQNGLCSTDLYSLTCWFMFRDSVSSSEFTSADDICRGQNCLLYCFSDTPCHHYHHTTSYNTIPQYICLYHISPPTWCKKSPAHHTWKLISTLCCAAWSVCDINRCQFRPF